jgi:HD-GYP domain-containing protein (c-di-GMP phosphodiesterase class II)
VEVTGLHRVSTTEIRAGMRLGKSIIMADGRVLLQAGTVLKESFIDPLLAHGVAAVYVVNELAPDVEPVDVISDETRQRLGAELKKTMAEIDRTFSEAAKLGVRRFRASIRAERLKATVDQIIGELMANPKATVSLQDIRTADEYTLGHSVNVCILSTLLGVELGYSPQELRELALGALLHDVGKTAVPPEILNKPGKLTPDEIAIMNQHTTMGWMMLKDQREISYTAAIVALQHHERWSGGGYPMNLSGNQIYKFARVTAVADCYDAMVADRVYRKGLSPAVALETLSGPMHGYFEPRIILSFLNCVAPWPVGSMVEITGGQKAVIVSAERGKADRPRVRVLLEPDGTPIAQPFEIDLFRERSVDIVRTLHEDADAYFNELAG